MRRDHRLSRVLHVLLHLRDMDAPATSELLGKMLNTNASFVRRTMAGLRNRGWVTSSRGHSGGWSLATPLSAISLLALYEALDSPTLFALGPSNDAQKCLMEQAANAALTRALNAAETAFRESLAGVTVADLAEDFEQRLEACGLSAWVPPGDLKSTAED